MKLTKRVVALLLTVMLVVTALPLGIFATDETVSAASLTFTGIADAEGKISDYKQYQTTWTDSTYVKGDVQLTVYYDGKNATPTLDVIFYVINWNGTRIGTESDVNIVSSYIGAAASVESGDRAAVIVVDYGGNTNATAGTIEFSLAMIRKAFVSGGSLALSDDGETTVPVDPDYVYVLPAGYRVARDITYFDTSVHASLGTSNSVINAWNTYIAGNKTIYYAYHTGYSEGVAADEEAGTAAVPACTYDHANNTGVDCVAGAPQYVNDEVVPYAAGQKAPKVTRVQDCLQPDGDEMEYECRLDIVYPAFANEEDAAKYDIPVYAQAATHSPRMNNVGVITEGTYNGETKDKVRTGFVGFTFSGYAAAVFDYAYIPMSRQDGEHYGYIDSYGTHSYNAAKVARAAVRCIRYYGEKYGYGDTIGVAGLSKGTPTAAVLSVKENKYVQELETYSNVTVNDAADGVEYYEGDFAIEDRTTALNSSGKATLTVSADDANRIKVQQPYMYYEDGTTEISSDVSVVYCAAGDGIDWIAGVKGSNTSIMLENVEHVPMVLSCGYYDQYECWYYWSSIQKCFTEYATEPFLAIGMEDMGHDYPSGIDPLRDYDRYQAFVQFFHSVLKPSLHTSNVAWITPVDSDTDVLLGKTIQVQLINATSLDVFKAGVTVADQNGTVAGTWTTNAKETSGLYTFVPSEEFVGGNTYTITVSADLAKNGVVTKTFIAAKGQPVADAYVSKKTPNIAHGSSEHLYINGGADETILFTTFKKSDFEDKGFVGLNVPVTNDANLSVNVYWIDNDNCKVDEKTLTYNTMPTLSDENLVGQYTLVEGQNALDISSAVEAATGDYFTLAFRAAESTKHVFRLDFEETTSFVKKNDKNQSYTDEADYRVAGNGAYTDLAVIQDPHDAVNKVLHTEMSGTKTKDFKLFNSLGYSGLTTADAGKTYRISFKVKTDKNNVSITYGLIPWSGSTYESGYSTTVTSGKFWTTVTWDVTIDETLSQNNNLMFGWTLSTAANYYFDDISVVELADEKELTATVASREGAAHANDTIFSFTRTSINKPIADTYVSRSNLNTVYGTEENLLLGDADGDKKLMVLSFAKKVLENSNNVLLNMPNGVATLQDVSVFWIDNYLLDEATLTYKTMPAYESNFLGTYDFVSGTNKLDLSSIRNQLTGDFFTLVFRTDAHSFKQDFEGYSSTQTFSNDATNNQQVNGTWYYYDYPATGAEASQSLARRGGSLGGIKIATESDGNQVLSVSTSKNAMGVGRLKFFNSLTGAEVGKTYRFTATVKLDSLSSNAHVTASVMLSVGTSAIKDANRVPIQTTKTSMSKAGDTVTLTLDYTVRAEDIAADATATIDNVSTPVKVYPMFTLEFGDGSSSKAEQNTYYVDDLSVVEVTYEQDFEGYDCTNETEKLYTNSYNAETERWSRTEASYNVFTLNKNADKKENTVTEGGITYYYGYSTEEMPLVDSLARLGGGNVASYRIVEQTDGNQVLRVHTGGTATGEARLKFYNSLSGAEVGKTYRFTADVMLAGTTTSNKNDGKVVLCVMPSNGSTDVITGKDVGYLTATTLTTGTWQTLSVDYTVCAEDIAAFSTDGTYCTYPMFSICFKDGTNTGFYYLVDNLSVVEIDDGNPTTFDSREVESGDSVKLVNGMNNVVTANVSSTTTGNVFTADGNALLSVVDGKLVFTEADGTTYNLCKYDGTEYDLTTLSEGESVTVAAIYDGDTVRFAVGGSLACYGEGMITYGLPYNGVIDVAGTAYEEAPGLIGYQKNLVDETSVRFLAGIDSLYYTSIGFRVVRDGKALAQESSSPYVFTSINIGDNDSVDVTDYDCNYMTALILEGINSSGVITVIPYVTVGENVIIYGAPETYEITFADDVVSIKNANSTESAE